MLKAVVTALSSDAVDHGLAKELLRRHGRFYVCNFTGEVMCGSRSLSGDEGLVSMINSFAKALDDPQSLSAASKLMYALPQAAEYEEREEAMNVFLRSIEKSTTLPMLHASHPGCLEGALAVVEQVLCPILGDLIHDFGRHFVWIACEGGPESGTGSAKASSATRSLSGGDKKRKKAKHVAAAGGADGRSGDSSVVVVHKVPTCGFEEDYEIVWTVRLLFDRRTTQLFAAEMDVVNEIVHTVDEERRTTIQKSFRALRTALRQASTNSGVSVSVADVEEALKRRGVIGLTVPPTAMSKRKSGPPDPREIRLAMADSVSEASESEASPEKDRERGRSVDAEEDPTMGMFHSAPSKTGWNTVDGLQMQPDLMPGERIQCYAENVRMKFGVSKAVAKNDAANSGQSKKSRGGVWNKLSLSSSGSVAGVASSSSSKRRFAVPGLLYITNYQLAFMPTPPARNTSQKKKKKESSRVMISAPITENDEDAEDDIDMIRNAARHFQTYIPLMMMYRAKKSERSFEVSTKDFRTLQFSFKTSNFACSDFFDRLKSLFPAQPSDSFAFRYLPQNPYKIELPPLPSSSSDRNIVTEEGWQLYDVEGELRRQGIPDSMWRVTRVNESYELCDTYPRLLAVPTTVTDEELLAVKEFRSRGRIPVLCWRHPHTLASITRCSQPRVGIRGAHCSEDEAMMKKILRACREPHSLVGEFDTGTLYLMDARPKANAVANQAMGAGFEDSKRYKNSKLCFLNIPNIHVMRDSVRRLHDLCTTYVSSGNWLSTLENTKWLDYISLLLASGARIAHLLSAGTSVVIHCSDGWDRTPQLSTLSMLMLDPYYRTIKGFAVLIEKEWCSPGHKFEDRMGHIYPWNESETSPVFMQFIDCVWQIHRQFPCAFEFTTDLLIYILDHSSSGLYGSFLCNSDMQRKNLDLASTTVSIWSHVLEREDFVNPLYRVADPGEELLLPHTHTRELALWTDYYLRHSIERVLSGTSTVTPASVCREKVAAARRPRRPTRPPRTKVPLEAETTERGEEESETQGVSGGDAPAESTDEGISDGAEGSGGPPAVPPPMEFNFLDIEESIRKDVRQKMEKEFAERVDQLVEERLKERLRAMRRSTATSALRLVVESEEETGSDGSDVGESE